MSICTWQLSTQRRVSSLAVAVGLLLWLFVHPGTPWIDDAIHFVTGLLLGVSLIINLRVLWRMRRGRAGSC